MNVSDESDSESAADSDWWRLALQQALGFDLNQSLVAPQAMGGTLPKIQAWAGRRLGNLSPAHASRIKTAVAIRASELDVAHAEVQEANDADGMLWHAIIHRLDGDLENSRYWYRRVGRHSVHTRLADSLKSSVNLPDRIAALASPGWNLNQWIELHRSKLTAQERVHLERLAIREWECLFENALRDAAGEL